MVSATPHKVKSTPDPPAPTEPRVQRNAAAACFRIANAEEDAGGNPYRVLAYRRAGRILVRLAGGVGGKP